MGSRGKVPAPEGPSGEWPSQYGAGCISEDIHPAKRAVMDEPELNEFAGKSPQHTDQY